MNLIAFMVEMLAAVFIAAAIVVVVATVAGIEAKIEGWFAR